LKYEKGIDKATATALLVDYLNQMGDELGKLPLSFLLPNQVDALFSFAYNCGFESLVNSSFYRQIIHQELDLSSWLEYCHDARGVKLAGLYRRRHAELRLFLYGIYDTN
jgi:GH24 family phage-related lysozyme (muramidase)